MPVSLVHVFEFQYQSKQFSFGMCFRVFNLNINLWYSEYSFCFISFEIFIDDWLLTQRINEDKDDCVIMNTQYINLINHAESLWPNDRNTSWKFYKRLFEKFQYDYHACDPNILSTLQDISQKAFIMNDYKVGYDASELGKQFCDRLVSCGVLDNANLNEFRFMFLSFINYIYMVQDKYPKKNVQQLLQKQMKNMDINNNENDMNLADLFRDDIKMDDTVNDIVNENDINNELESFLNTSTDKTEINIDNSKNTIDTDNNDNNNSSNNNSNNNNNNSNSHDNIKSDDSKIDETIETHQEPTKSININKSQNNGNNKKKDKKNDFRKSEQHHHKPKKVVKHVNKKLKKHVSRIKKAKKKKKGNKHGKHYNNNKHSNNKHNNNNNSNNNNNNNNDNNHDIMDDENMEIVYTFDKNNIVNKFINDKDNDTKNVNNMDDELNNKIIEFMSTVSVLFPDCNDFIDWIGNDIIKYEEKLQIIMDIFKHTVTVL